MNIDDCSWHPSFICFLFSFVTFLFHLDVCATARIRCCLFVYIVATRNAISCFSGVSCRVSTGQRKLEKVTEFEWSGKVRENAKVTGKSGKFGGKFYLFAQLL